MSSNLIIALNRKNAQLEDTVKGMGAALRLSHPYKKRAEKAEARVAELTKQLALAWANTPEVLQARVTELELRLQTAEAAV